MELKDPGQLREGQTATFYARGWIVGEGVALREMGHRSRQAASTMQSDMQMQEKLNAEIRSRIETADVVAVGKVTAVQALSVAAPSQKFITEHDPDWREAVIEVESGLKGVRSGEKIVVRFPSSDDVAWYEVPKFKQGQTGVFFLQVDKVTGLKQAMVSGRETDTYVVQKPFDVLPKEETERIRSLMRKK